MTPEEKLKEECKGLVEKWSKTGLLDGLNSDLENSNMAILTESNSTLIMEDGYRIDYMTEEEKEQKLKEYYGSIKNFKKKRGSSSAERVES